MKDVLPEKMQLNSNSKLVATIKQRIAMCGGYCPCVPNSNGHDDYLCPCKKAREEQECCCNLYIKEN